MITVGGCTIPDAGTGAKDGDVPQRQVPVAVENLDSCSSLSARPPATQTTGKRLPDIELPCLTRGPAVNLSALGGRPIVVNLWATWCGPCRAEMPLLQDAHTRYGDQVQFLGVDTKDNPARASAFLREVGVTYPQVVDIDGKLLGHLRSPGLPVTVVLDSDGTVADRNIGPVTADSLEEMIDQVLP